MVSVWKRKMSFVSSRAIYDLSAVAFCGASVVVFTATCRETNQVFHQGVCHGDTRHSAFQRLCRCGGWLLVIDFPCLGTEGRGSSVLATGRMQSATRDLVSATQKPRCLSQVHS